MSWLVEYSHRKKVTISGTSAGDQTSYQMKLVVGESNTASGTDTHCESHCQDFPNDIRFTDTNGTTKHDYWIETGSSNGTTPNQKVTIWIEVASIPHPSPVNLYMYYGKSLDSGESNGNNTCVFFDDFQNIGEGDWDKDIGDTAEHPIIKNDTLYFVGNGIWILGLDGAEQHHYLSGLKMYCAPVVLGDYVYSWEHDYNTPGENNRLHKTKISDGTDTEIAGTRVDFECLSSTTISGIDVIFIPKNENVTAIKASDLSTCWTSSVIVEGGAGDACHWDGGLVLGNYLYTRQVKTGDHKLFKLNLNNGTTADSVVLEDENHYSVLTYDIDNNQIIVTEKNTMKVKAFDKDDFTLNWTKTLDETGIGWYIMYSVSYNNNKLYISDKQGSGNQSYIYCLDTVSGTQIWKSTVPYNNNVTVTNHLLSDNYLFCPTHDYYDNDYYKMMVLNISDGSLDSTISQSSNSSCCTPVYSNGIMYLGMWTDHNINARKLGTGNKADCPYKCDSAHTGYIGNRLTNYSPNPQYNITDKWTNSGDFDLFNGTLRKYAANTDNSYHLISKTTYSKPLAIEAKIKVGDDWSDEWGWNFAISWDSAWSTLGYLAGHYKDVSLDYFRVFRWSSGLTDSDQTNESISADMWYNCSLLIGLSDQTYNINGIQKAALITSPPTDSTNIILSTSRQHTSSDYTTYFDWVFVRKYASPEPTWGNWDNEESRTNLKSINTITKVNIKSINKTYIVNIKYINLIEP